MKIGRIVGLFLLALVVSTVQADERKKSGVKISDKSFRKISSTFLNDPLSKSARDWARLIMLYTLDSPNATIVLGDDEWKWSGLDRDDSRALLLLAAYSTGNIQSQFNSGVKRNDRYSGLLTLFHVYRELRDVDEKYKVAAVDELLALHQADKLLPYLRELEKNEPMKWAPAQEAAVRRLMKNR